MIPWELLGRAQVPGNGGELCLYRRNEEYSMRVNNCELMNSRVHGSEDALAELVCERMPVLCCPRLLIGGLGMGYTLASALRRIGADGRVVVAELVPAVIEWNRGQLAGLAGHPLHDTRVTVHEVDVLHILREERGAYDAILIDVDNGPEGLTTRCNDRLYDHTGLDAAFAALRPAGMLAIWSAGQNRAFVKRLHQTGFTVEEVPVRARGRSRGGRHTIWIARRGPYATEGKACR